MQLMRCAVVRVLIALQLSIDCCCHIIPDSNRSPTHAENNAASIQICGTRLTTVLIEICGGSVRSLNHGSETTDSKQRRAITEECCYHPCTSTDLKKYCADDSPFKSMDEGPGKSASKEMESNSGEMAQSDQGPKGMSVERGRTWGQTEVRVRGDTNGSRKKKKRSFKRKCAYKSFGHYLLKLDRGDGSKVQNKINRKWPPIQIGTVSPEIDKFGGQPIVDVKKKRFKSV